ncbi:MAG: AraC family transcriptional regulator [Citrobacter freundii]|nr:MAG: AraC family transcriptional regulator [Citrobacter freundii]
MKKHDTPHHNFHSITAAHRALDLPDPKHPLISLINGCSGCATDIATDRMAGSHVLSFYKISYKPKLSGNLKYGQRYYDFDGGGLLFAAPGQVIGPGRDGGEDVEAEARSRYTLLIHPDFFLGYPLAKKIKQYGFFSYSVYETLHLSDEEKETIISIFSMIEKELESRIDDLSQDVVVSQVELLLNFANRFYKRQFITRKAANNDLLTKLEELLDTYFNDDSLLRKGVPSVAWLAAQLNLSPSYLSDMLRSLTGRNAQQQIHDRVIGKAKEMLTTTDLSISEVAYALGFEYSQSFSKLFKREMKMSPVEFRGSFDQAV